mmetsp:Transcript_18223/g.41181  ORF Transcript_18223/g.41181 Transcript_18223/m.41181 type:complete len:282 (-) Transcript_18223:93-938(-)
MVGAPASPPHAVGGWGPALAPLEPRQSLLRQPASRQPLVRRPMMLRQPLVELYAGACHTTTTACSGPSHTSLGTLSRWTTEALFLANFVRSARPMRWRTTGLRCELFSSALTVWRTTPSGSAMSATGVVRTRYRCSRSITALRSPSCAASRSGSSSTGPRIPPARSGCISSTLGNITTPSFIARAMPSSGVLPRVIPRSRQGLSRLRSSTMPRGSRGRSRRRRRLRRLSSAFAWPSAQSAESGWERILPSPHTGATATTRRLWASRLPLGACTEAHVQKDV